MRYLPCETISYRISRDFSIPTSPNHQSTLTYRLDEVARSICSSRAEFEANQPVIIVSNTGGLESDVNDEMKLSRSTMCEFERMSKLGNAKLGTPSQGSEVGQELQI